MVVLLIVGLVLLIGLVAVIRHSRSFRGYGEHYADEERPEVKLSRARGPEGGGFV